MKRQIIGKICLIIIAVTVALSFVGCDKVLPETGKTEAPTTEQNEEISDEKEPPKIEAGEKKKKAAAITIGNHVWLCAHSTVMKGTSVGDDCVVAYGSLLTKAGGEKGLLYAGVPAKPRRNNITWEE